MLNRTGLSSRLAWAKAASDHGCQSTGLWACCRRYGLVSLISRLVCLCSVILFPLSDKLLQFVVLSDSALCQHAGAQTNSLRYSTNYSLNQYGVFFAQA